MLDTAIEVMDVLATGFAPSAKQLSSEDKLLKMMFRRCHNYFRYSDPDDTEAPVLLGADAAIPLLEAIRDDPELNNKGHGGIKDFIALDHVLNPDARKVRQEVQSKLESSKVYVRPVQVVPGQPASSSSSSKAKPQARVMLKFD